MNLFCVWRCLFAVRYPFDWEESEILQQAEKQSVSEHSFHLLFRDSKKKAIRFQSRSSKPERRYNESSATKCSAVCKSGCKNAGKCPRFLGLEYETRWATVHELWKYHRYLRQHGGKCDAKPCGKSNCSFNHHELRHKDLTAITGPSNNSNVDVKTPPITWLSSTFENCQQHSSSKNSLEQCLNMSEYE